MKWKGSFLRPSARRAASLAAAVVLTIPLCAWHCAAADSAVLTAPETRIRGPFDPEKLAQMDAAIETAIEEHNTPGSVLWLEHGTNQYHKAFGKRALVPNRESMTEDTIFDAASLTKVLATAPSVMLLMERGKRPLTWSAGSGPSRLRCILCTALNPSCPTGLSPS